LKKKADENGKIRLRKHHSYKHSLFTAIFLIAFLIIISSISSEFLYTKQMVEKQAEYSRNEVSEQIVYDMSIINKGLEIYDMSLNNRLETDFIYFLDEYEKSEGNPSLMDLDSVAAKTSSEVSLYIINESYVITHATNPLSIGLDFKTYAPYYVNYLEKIKNSEGFFPERVMSEKETGLLKKFGYMATPDNRYVLEISLYDEEFNNLRNELKYSEQIEKIVSKNPYIKNVRIFNRVYKQVANSSFKPQSEFSDFLEEIFSSENGQDIIDGQTGETIRYLYIPLKSEKYGSDNSLIAELVFDNSPVETAMSQLIWHCLLIAIISTGLCIACSFAFSRYFSSTVEDAIKDISIISNGNLAHKLKDSSILEFSTLKTNIENIVDNIKKNVELSKRIQDCLNFEKEKSEKYFTIADVIFIVSDKSGKIKEINTKSLEIFGFSEEEATGKDFFYTLFTDNNREIIKSLFYEKMETGAEAPFNFRCKISTKSGETRDLNLNTVFLTDSCSRITGWITTGNDLTDDLEIRRALESSLTEKSTLLREVHHRVNNNLQVIISLFELKSYLTDDENLLKYINESKSRITAMALVHKIMYDSDNFARVNIPDYIKKIVSAVFSSQKIKTDVSVEYDLDEIFFDLDNSVPFGILLNELLLNSLIHAFKDRDFGKIKISLKKKPDSKIIFTFSDDGRGLPPDNEPEKRETLGLNLIKNLVRQLSGSMQIIRGNGTSFVIELEEPKEQLRF